MQNKEMQNMSLVPARPKPLEGKPATISRISVKAKANASGLAVRGKGDQRPFFLMDVNGGIDSLSANLQYVLH